MISGRSIVDCRAREVFDSRGELTLEVEVHLDDGAAGRAIVPAGMSKGKLEAVSLYDDNKRKTLACAIDKVEKAILPAIVKKEFFMQHELDQLLIELDGTDNKSNLGANSMLGVSMSFAMAMGESRCVPLYKYISEIIGARPIMPRPFVNVINGGAHANNGLSFQEFMIAPPEGMSFKDGILIMRDVFIGLRHLLKRRGHSIAVGDEGGFAPSISSEIEALDLLEAAVKEAGYIFGVDVFVALDVAASHFYDGKIYLLNGRNIDGVQLINHYDWLRSKYPIISIEDPVAEDDMASWKIMTQKLGAAMEVVGDDVFVTNEGILRKGVQDGIANAVLIKPNQVGTITETCRTAKLALDSGYKIMISHRSGDTEDTSIAHIAVGLGGGQIKTGSLCRSERTAKYNELLRIEEGMQRGGEKKPERKLDSKAMTGQI